MFYVCLYLLTYLDYWGMVLSTVHITESCEPMIYEITVEGDYFGQQCVNRWNYVSSGVAVGVTGSAALLQAFGLVPTSGIFPSGTIAHLWQFLVGNVFTYKQAIVKAIREAPTDFIDFAYAAGVAGQEAGGQDMSPINAYGFFTNRVRTDVARATKRFAGVSENRVDDGGYLNTGAISQLNALAAAMSADLSYTDGGSSLTFKPVVCGKFMYTTPPEKKAYKYYDTIAEQLDHTAVGITWQPYTQVRSQVSRQYGHGR